LIQSAIHNLRSLLSERGRRKSILLLWLYPLSAATQVLVLATVVPFTVAAVQPDLIFQSTWFQWVSTKTSWNTPQDFLFLSGLALVFGFFLSNIVGMWAKWLLIRLTFDEYEALAQRLLTGSLQQPYEWFLTKSSNQLLNSILLEGYQVTIACLRPVLEGIGNVGVVLCVLMVLLWIHPASAILALLFLLLAYGVLYRLVRKELDHHGHALVKVREQRMKVLQECLLGYKDIRILEAEAHFASHFMRVGEEHSHHQSRSDFILESGRYILELLLVAGTVFVYLLARSGDDPSPDLIPLLAVYAVAALRLLPLMQRSFAALTRVKLALPAVSNLVELFDEFEAVDPAVAKEEICFRERLELEAVDYQYPQGDELVLSDVSITINRGETVGIVGVSGGGKSTILDLLAGFLKPAQGRVLVDGHPLTAASAVSWRRQIGYVGQSGHLLDGTVTENIVLGREGEHDAVEAAARLARIHDFVLELKDGYDTRVGDRGFRFSGGQKQRVALARAFFRQPETIILDEATNALDQTTEAEILHELRQDRTVILVTHRLSATRECDKLYVLEEGRVVSCGSYSELEKECPVFNRLIRQEQSTVESHQKSGSPSVGPK
jgi:ABC-type multidrug transport system fused ATPase/permease subunit